MSYVAARLIKDVTEALTFIAREVPRGLAAGHRSVEHEINKAADAFDAAENKLALAAKALDKTNGKDHHKSAPEPGHPGSHGSDSGKSDVGRHDGTAGGTHDPTSTPGTSGHPEAVKLESGADWTPQTSHGQLHALAATDPGHTALVDALNEHGLTANDLHDQIAKIDQTGVHLTPQEAATVIDIRRAVPTPQADAILQKVIPDQYATRYLNNFDDGRFKLTEVGGFVNNSADVLDVRTPTSLREANGLDYPGGPIPDNTQAFVMRFQPRDPSMLKIPLSDDVTNLAQVERAPREASVNYDYPYTGAGFTNSTEHLVPEYKFDRFARIKPGAEIWRVDPSGRETLLGIFGEDEVWVKVVPHE